MADKLDGSIIVALLENHNVCWEKPSDTEEVFPGTFGSEMEYKDFYVDKFREAIQSAEMLKGGQLNMLQLDKPMGELDCILVNPVDGTAKPVSCNQ